MENVSKSISISKEIDERLRSVARETGQTKNSLIQQALREFIENREILAIEKELQAKARALGIQTEDDVVDLIHDYRKNKNR